MNDTELNIAIAELRGWKIENFRGLLIGLPPDRLDDGTHFSVQQMPDYATDLNACHEAAMSLDRDTLQYSTYCSHLNQIVAIHNSRSDARPIQSCDATARQRAEALYLTLK